MRAFWISILMIVMLMGWAVKAQQGLNVSGSVEDQAGGVIPGATLTLTNTASGEMRVTASDANGGFTFADVIAGQYVITCDAPDFESFKMDLVVGDQPLEPLKVKLEIKIKSEEVVIQDSKSEKAIDDDNNLNAIDLGADFLKTLPAQSEDILPIIGNFLSTAAQGTEGLSVVVDGVEGTTLTLPADAIKRVLINRNPYSSTYRRPGEGRVEVLTKDGSRRRYDGTFAFYMRKSSFDARDTFTRRQGLTIADLDRRLISGSFGGPVPKLSNATFFLSFNHLMHNEDVLSDTISLTGVRTFQHAPTSQQKTKFLGRFDLRPNQVHTLSTRYYYYRDVQQNAGLGAPFVLPEQGYPLHDSGQRFLFSDRAILSPTWLNDLTVSFTRENERQGGKPDSYKTVVRGNFIGGPSQVDVTSSETTLDINDGVTYTPGNHTIRFGGGFRTRHINSVDATNFVGTYFFQGAPDYIDRRPIEFRVTQGDPANSVSLYELSGFIEDELRLRRWLSITPGIRYDWQSNIRDHNNFGPRVSFALAPGSDKMVIRGGIGIFYERLPGNVTRQLFIDGVDTKELSLFAPSYPDPFRVTGRPRPQRPPSKWQVAPDLTAPYLMMTSLSFERQLWHRSTVSVEYQKLHGVHLLRTRNINAPLDPSIFGYEFTGVRLNPNFTDINQVESSASSRASTLKVNFRARVGKWFKGMAQYTYSKATDDTGGPLVRPVNNWILTDEVGRSNFDMRHRFSYAGTFDMPFAFRLGSVLSITSGRPYDIITGYDDNGDQNPYDRPPGGMRNSAQGPPIMQLDLRLTKLFRIPTLFAHKAGVSERKLRNLELSIDAFNVLNHPNTPVIVGELQSAVFGQSSTANMSRTLQFSVKYSF